MRRLTVALVCLIVALGVRAAPAQAFSPVGAVCGLASLASGLLGKACSVVSSGGKLLSAGKQIVTGHLGGAIKTILGRGSGVVGSGAKAALTLAAVGAWVLGGARFALHETAKVLSETTSPQLTTSWFSATYWRVAGIAALLTLPFLFAASVQALVHSDLALLLRTVLGYLPLAMLLVGIAAPVTMLLLSASDELASLVSKAAGHPGSQALTLGGVLAGGLSALSGSPFLIFFLGLLTVAGAMTLWMELLMREAAVYVVVLMLPLAFAALVWPARRVWATRAVELLVALILSKFAIVAVLSLGGAAMDQVGHSITAPIVGLVLVMMGAFAPWALLRLVPLAELGASAVESLRGQGRMVADRTEHPHAVGLAADEWATATTSEMRRGAEPAAPDHVVGPPPTDGSSGGGDPAGEEVTSAEVPDPLSGAGEGDLGDLNRGASNISPDAGLGGPAGNSAPVGARSERLPGLPDMWQADDLAWQPLVLGAEEGWPPRVWPAQEGGQSGLPPDPEGPAADGLEGVPVPEPPPGSEPMRPSESPPESPTSDFPRSD